MSVAVLVITDGRGDLLAETVRHAMANLRGPVTEWWMYDDTGDPDERARLHHLYPTFTHFDGGPRQGFGGAIRACWRRLAAASSADWVFHLEGDFRLARRIDLDAMIGVLAPRPHLLQMALRRQAWSPAELAAGGVVEANPAAFTDCDDGQWAWLEHRAFWTTNPSLYRRSLCWRGWPAGNESEGRYGLGLLHDGVEGVRGEDVRFGYWGHRGSGIWCEHLGHQRAGRGY